LDSAREAGITVLVDPKGKDWAKYKGAEIICPNVREFEEWDGRYCPPVIVRKMGELGISVSQHGKSSWDVPAVSRKVFDVTGAGDTLIATMACALGARASLRDASRLAVMAAAHVVGEPGTAVCSAEDLCLMAAQVME
jgi:D-beta-D-heptose 7-phosphate kinase/D-beta-D-heptose 1-phosphate adenosyltransferase